MSIKADELFAALAKAEDEGENLEETANAAKNKRGNETAIRPALLRINPSGAIAENKIIANNLIALRSDKARPKGEEHRGDAGNEDDDSQGVLTIHYSFS
jgi:hypothetical protein